MDGHSRREEGGFKDRGGGEKRAENQRRDEGRERSGRGEMAPGGEEFIGEVLEAVQAAGERQHGRDQSPLGERGAEGDGAEAAGGEEGGEGGEDRGREHVRRRGSEAFQS